MKLSKPLLADYQQHFFDAVQVFIDIRVPNPLHFPSQGFQSRRSVCVAMFLIEMGLPVYLDDQLALDACEIDDEIRNRMLAAKLQTGESAIPERRPKAILGWDIVPPQCASLVDAFRFGHRLPPSPGRWPPSPSAHTDLASACNRRRRERGSFAASTKDYACTLN